MSDVISVLIPDGEEILALHAARCLAQSQNVKLYILSGKRWAWSSFSRHRHLYRFEPVRGNHEERLKASLEIIKEFGIDVLLPVSDEGVEFVAAKRHVLSEIVTLAPVPELQTLRTARNKWLLNQFACDLNIPVPPSLLVTLDSDFWRQLSGLSYPVLLKPTLRGGGEGIQQFETCADLQNFLAGQAEEQFKNKYLVQSCVPGSDLSLNVLCRNGEILAFNIQQGLIGAAERFGPPRVIQYISQPQVLEYGRRLLAALHWNGVANIDMLYDEKEDQVRLLEVNARFWGSTPGPLGVGINFPYLTCLTALGIPFPTPKYRSGKYLHTGTAAKEMFLRFFDKSQVDQFSFRETGLRFFVKDPLPELVPALAKWARRQRERRWAPAGLFRFLDEVS